MPLSLHKTEISFFGSADPFKQAKYSSIVNRKYIRYLTVISPKMDISVFGRYWKVKAELQGKFKTSLAKLNQCKAWGAPLQG